MGNIYNYRELTAAGKLVHTFLSESDDFFDSKNPDECHDPRYIGTLACLNVLNNQNERYPSEFGTCFQVLPGTFITAAHVVNDRLSELASGEAFAQISLPVGVGKPAHFFGESFRIVKEADLAITSCIPTFFPEKINLASLRLSPRIPNVGENVTIFGLRDNDETAGEKKIVQGLRATAPVQEVFRDGRDSVMLPQASFSIGTETLGGMSGGPVLDELGCVIGVVSLGSTLQDGSGITYASCIHPVFPVEIENSWAFGKSLQKKLREYPLSTYLLDLIEYKDTTKYSVRHISFESFQKLVELRNSHGVLPNVELSK